MNEETQTVQVRCEMGLLTSAPPYFECLSSRNVAAPEDCV